MNYSIKLLLLILLSSCSLNKDISRNAKTPEKNADELLDHNLSHFDTQKNSVLLLLPLSGSSDCIGQSILRSCMLAAPGLNDVDFHVIDTKNSSLEQFKIYNRFRNKNLKAIIGPVFSQEVKSYGSIFPNVPILSFSNNQKINNWHTFACGLSLQDEIQALAAYAGSHKINSFLIMLPNGEFEDQVLEIISNELKKSGLEEGDDFESIRYTSISRKNATKYAKNSNKKAIFVVDPILDIQKLNGVQVFTISSVALSNKEIWNGAIFAFADNEEQKIFTKKYYSAFGKYPAAIDIIAHDLANVVKESINSGISIVGNHSGCMGDFSISKDSGLTRKLEIFYLENSEKIPATNMYQTH